MNKRKIVITSFLGVCLITGLSACGTLAATPPKNSNPQNTSYQAQEISNTENKSDDFQTDERPGESTDYSIYEPYGLKYEKEKRYYTYNGDIVRFFNDPIAGASFTNFFTGTVDIEAERDKDNNLIGIKECSKEVYAQHTEKHNGVNSTGGIANNDTTQDGGTSGVCISVTRNSNNEISEVKLITETEAQSIMQNNSPTGADFTEEN